MMQPHKSLAILSLLLLTSCNWLWPREVVVQTEYVDRTIPIQVRPKGIVTYPVKFFVVTEENFEEFKATFEDEYSSFVFFALGVPDYENLSLNMAEIRRYIEQQKTLILYYENSIKPNEMIDDQAELTDEQNSQSATSVAGQLMQIVYSLTR